MNDKIKTAEQSLAEAEKAALESDSVRKAREAVEAAKRELKEREKADEEAKRIAAREKEAAKYLAVCEPIVKALCAAGLKAKIRNADPSDRWHSNPSIDCGNEHIRIIIEAETRKSGWHYHSTGRLVCIVDAWTTDQRPRRFPQKTDGSFNLDKIVAHVKEMDELVIAKNKAEAEKKASIKSASELVAILCEEYSLPTYGPVKSINGLHYGKRWVENAPAAGKVFVEVGTVQVTPDEAREVLNLMIKLGKIRKETK